MRAVVRVLLKPNVPDMHGAAVKSSLQLSGFSQIRDIRYGRLFQLDLDLSREEAAQQLEGMCQKLLANTLIEDYEWEIINVSNSK